MALGLILLSGGCSGAATEFSAVPIRGRVEFEISPNPIRAIRLEENQWSFPFEVTLRESGGVDVEIETLRLTVTIAGLPVARMIWDGAEIEKRGYSTAIPAGEARQYAFTPVRTVPDERLLTLARADINVAAVDRDGRRSEATRTISVVTER
ncbi:MAG TPA: hypothetical protein VMS12_05220 [Thermoanaerobaculia bacterium]|nr:hypothetical protein [Thermoanaerobaculia bacterium]